MSQGEETVRAATPILIVGGGRMGEAIAGGLLKAGIVAAGDLRIAEPDESRRDRLADVLGVSVAQDAVAAGVGEAGTVLLAVKPQVIDDVIAGFTGALSDPLPLVISIAAGVPTVRLEALLSPGTPVVRVMPNTPALVGAGVSAVSAGARATSEHLAATESLFRALGVVVVVDERLQDAVTAVSGSGPAYVALFVDALATAGVKNGLSPEIAYVLALETLRGTAELLARDMQTPAQLVESVSSPGGTTLAARKVLERGRFSEILIDAVAAAAARSRELGAG